ncbi:hypothetical protein A2706_04745 [Candidatus Peribacteria bacterium RIFCSPHIGHO2_01_FULL_51_35]|nr:MAG: hypothetical protein A2706_04745 [Candidatus Peribacteria bacterium RIFCSPHIGHO2_01_FULL_51_35]
MAHHLNVQKIPLSGDLLIALEGQLSLCSVALCHEALFAEHGLASLLDWARLEGDLALSTTFCTCGIVHFSCREAFLLASRTAILATLGSAEVLAGVEFLFTIGERERSAAIATCKLLISHTV